MNGGKKKEKGSCSTKHETLRQRSVCSCEVSNKNIGISSAHLVYTFHESKIALSVQFVAFFGQVPRKLIGEPDGSIMYQRQKDFGKSF